MSEQIKKYIRSSSDKSSDLIITEEYLILKGNHYVIENGYIKNIKQARTIELKDILEVKYITMRSKMWLKRFIVCVQFCFLEMY